MQELHCRPLFQADPLMTRVESFCQKPIDSGFHSEEIKKLLHQKTNTQHDSSDLWPQTTQQETPVSIPEASFTKELLNFKNTKILGIFGVGLMGAMLLISIFKNFKKL